MILAAEAINMVHEAEQRENKKLLKEIEKKIIEATEHCQYYIYWDEPFLPGSAIYYLKSLGYEVTKHEIYPGKRTDDNYYYIIGWGK